MRSHLVVVSTPTFKLFSRVCQRHEPKRIQAFGAQSAVKRLDERVILSATGTRPQLIGFSIEKWGENSQVRILPGAISINY